MKLLLPALVLFACACDDATDGPRRGDCEALLAHLVVLERDTADPVICPQYHPSCGGDPKARYLRTCPKVLTRRELGCYQRATSLSAAGDCLALDVLDERIQTGKRGPPELEDADGASAEALRELRAIRDATCTCTDLACVTAAGDRLDRWMGRFEDLKGNQDDADDASRLYGETTECRAKIKGNTALFPDAAPYYDPYRDPYAPDARLTGLPDCDMYISLIEKMSNCYGLPQASRDALRDSVASLRTAYDGASMSDDIKRQTNESCRSGIDSMRQQLQSLGCL